MLEPMTSISPENQQAMLEYLNAEALPLLKPDVSSYARGRMRLWLEYEWDLKDRVFKPGAKLDRLWAFCKRIWPAAELGLLNYGPTGITFHRDDSYADYKAVGINLGACTWIYEREYPGYAWTRNRLNPPELTTMELTSGEVFSFNCKNRHAARNCAEHRWAINLWSVSKKCRSLFQLT